MKTQNEMKGEFEKLEEIAKLLPLLFFSANNLYYFVEEEDFDAQQFVNGAWYAFQEQQKKIDKIVYLVWSETPNYDLDNKIKEVLK